MSRNEELVLGLDLGTTNFKAALYTRTGECAGLGRAEVKLQSSDGMESVLPPEQFIAMLNKSITAALNHAGADADNIRGVSYSSQTNSFLLLDAENRPLTPLVIWNDRRAENPDDDFKALADLSDFLEQTGMGLFGPLSASSKLLWFRKNKPDIWDKTFRVMSISDYLCFLLTGLFTGDSSTASMTGLWSVRQGRWWDKAFELLNLDKRMFAESVPPGCTAGTISSEGASILPLPVGIPLAAGAQDHYMAALGAGIGRIADYSESTGTVLGLVSLIADFNPAENSVQGPGIFGNMTYYRMSFQDEGSVILNRYRNEYAEEIDFVDLSRLAGEVPAGSDGVFALLKTGSFSRHNNFHGQTDDTKHGQYVRAIMEAVAASLKRMLEKTGDEPDTVLATGGGARSDVWLQIKADMLNTEILAVDNQEPACTGAAMLAAVAAGWAGSPNELMERWVQLRKRFQPIEANKNYYFEWYRDYKSHIL